MADEAKEIKKKEESRDRNKTSEYSQLEWIDIKNIITSREPQEGLKEKMIRKTKENPFVPIGVLATTLALSFGLWAMQSGNSRRSQTMMRLRIGAQAFTVGALVIGLAIGASKSVVKPTT